MTSMEASLNKCLDTIARQNEQLASQAATLDRLFKAQADPEEVQTSTYEVADSILSQLGLTAQGKMSWLDIKPLPKSERRRILREHGGTFKTFPPDPEFCHAGGRKIHDQKHWHHQDVRDGPISCA